MINQIAVLVVKNIYSEEPIEMEHKVPTHSLIKHPICSENVVELLQPGSFVKLDNQPNDLPPFQIINCKGGRCLVRQQSWGKHVQWEVDHNRLKSA